MATSDPLRDMTDAERKVWLNIQHSRNADAGRANITQARDIIRQQEQAGRDRANEGGRDR